MNRPTSSLVYDFGGWTVDAHARTLKRGDETRTLDPRAMDVLIYLLDRAGEIIPSDELLDQVWRRRVVERSAVARNIHQIRTALGDNAKEPTFVETIPKRGYRTVAQAGRTDCANVPGIGILALENLSTDPDYAYLAAAITQDITTVLGQIHPALQVTRLQSPEQAAADFYVLSGSVRKSGSRVRVAVQLGQRAGGKHLWSERYDREFADLFALQDELVGDIVHAVGWATWRAIDAKLRHERPDNLNVWALLHQSQMIHFDRRTDAAKKNHPGGAGAKDRSQLRLCAQHHGMVADRPGNLAPLAE